MKEITGNTNVYKENKSTLMLNHSIEYFNLYINRMSRNQYVLGAYLLPYLLKTPYFGRTNSINERKYQSQID